LRMLRKNPGFALAAIITLALGIGGNTAVFTVTSAMLLKPLPYENPQELVALDVRQKDGQSGCCTLGWSDLVRERNKSFSSTAVAALDNLNLTGRGEPLQVAIGRVSPEFFELLGVKPKLGRSFLAEEGRPEGKPVAMITDSLWHSRFGGDTNVAGQTLTLDTTPYTIIGVLPPDVQFPFVGPAEVWIPRYFEYSLFTPQRLRMGVGYLSMYGRLRQGVSRRQALAELSVLHEQYRKENPTAPDADPNRYAAIDNLQDSLVANVRTRLIVLTCAVVLVLAIACANVASLLLSRAVARRKEIAVRAALGAPRTAIVNQLITESVMLALIAGAIGLGLSWAATRALTTWGANSLPQGIPVSIDGRVLLFTIFVSIFTGIIFGLFPALQLAGTNVNETLRDESRGASGGPARVRLRGMLVVFQVGLCVLLLIGAGLLIRSFERLLRVDPGLDAHNVITMNVNLPSVKYSKPEQQTMFFDDLLRRVSTLPGVRGAAISAALPLSWKRITPILPEGQPEVPLAQRPFIDIEAISPAWFKTLRVPLKLGREFTDADNAQAPKVVIINETLARRYWPNQNPVGRHLIMGRGPAASEIVGVAADVKNRGVALDPQPQLYFPFAQIPWGNMNLIVRTANDPHGMVASLRAQVEAIDPDQPINAVQTVDELMDASRAQPRSFTLLIGGFAALTLVLAIVGIYGVLAYSVAQRRQELGIRLALGADRDDIVRLVVRQGVRLALAGVGIGLVLAIVAAVVMKTTLAGVLFKTNVSDLATFFVVPLGLLLIAAVASYLPARRTTNVSPTEALR
jgi:putative ABC transport system permease protein